MNLNSRGPTLAVERTEYCASRAVQLQIGPSLGAMRFLRAKVGCVQPQGKFGAPVTARELLLGVLVGGALRICRRSRPEPDTL